MVTKLVSVKKYCKELPLVNAHDPQGGILVGPRDKLNTLYLHLPETQKASS